MRYGEIGRVPDIVIYPQSQGNLKQRAVFPVKPTFLLDLAQLKQIFQWVNHRRQGNGKKD